jgi:hypothetical protein
MSEADERLKGLFALDQPPPRDAAFVLETAKRIQKRLFWLELLAGAPWAVAASAILWAFAPVLEDVGRPMATLLAASTPAAVLAATAFFVLSPRSPAA